MARPPFLGGRFTVHTEEALPLSCGVEDFLPARFSPPSHYPFQLSPSTRSHASGTGNPAALGNYIAQNLIQFGLQDGSNEQLAYSNYFYEPFNPSLDPTLLGPNGLIDPNFWQPLHLDTYKSFLTADWGSVTPFALSEEYLTMYRRDGNDYPVYHDPGPPPHIQQDPQYSNLADFFRAFNGLGLHRDRTGLRMASEEYQWGFALVALWSSHLDPADGVLWDISPSAIGNAPELPQTLSEYQEFYNMLEGGDASRGHSLNPHTGQPYEKQWVPRADYARVVAEFWADGPETETPPGHWFTILNYVSDHPLFEKRFKGEGPVLDDLEWDVKAYFALGGAMHDAAVTAWDIKCWYDYVRPISAIRWLADQGQCSDSDLPHYDPAGMWGGIHPPADDIPARLIGTRIGVDAFALAEDYFSSPTQGAARRSAALVEDFAAELPREFALEQNYPNPFNSGTAITFDLPYRETVDLTVYTIFGQKVATLVQGPRVAGYHQVFWDGRDEAGAALASGLYLYRLQVGDQLKTRKMLLLR